MKIELNIPDPKFKVGDIVEIKNENNKRSRYVKILSYNNHYDISIYNDIICNCSEIGIPTYTVIVQMGSYHNDIVCTPFRHGSTIVFNCLDLEKFDIPKIYPYDETEIDTIENSKRRVEEWEEFGIKLWRLI